MSSSSVSSSSETPPETYEVFLSFRGKDTRANITGHLYKELRGKGIAPFKDDEELQRGDEISPSLIKAIETSLVSVVILSENYATSKWCLDELAKILECKRTYGRMVMPIFYHVYPTDVRYQTGSYGDAFAEHERNPKVTSDKLKRWRGALTEVADLSGWNSSDFGNESKLIEKIVQDILKRLNNMSTSAVKDGLVGLDSRIQEIERILSIGSMGVRTVGIWGLGGIGKTTLARAVFNKVCSGFESAYFIQDIRGTEEKTRLICLRQELFSTILDDENVKVATLCQGDTFTKRRLSRKKVLIVLDDVTDVGQIESLIGGFDWFGSKSRFILTSRDKQIIENCGVDEVYRVQELPYGDALELFSLKAFGQNHPVIDYFELSEWVVKYIDGLPLALTVFGSHLYGTTKEEMESAINKLKIIPHKKVHEVLKISYDGLDHEEQRVLLDITCLLDQCLTRQKVIDILDASGFCTDILRVLVKKCLINISEDELTMHDLVQQMVREIVQQESIEDPGRRVRLWDHKDIYNVLEQNKDTEKIESICLDISRIDYIDLDPKAFVKMPNLRIFNFYKSRKENNVHLSQGLVGSIFTELRYFRWDECPLKFLPSNFHHENLVEIYMPDSKVEELWHGVQHFPNLKYLDVRDSKLLAKIPDLSQAQNLVRVNLNGCSSLAEVHTSFQCLKKLVYLGLRSCTNLTSLPTLMSMGSLVELHLQDCSKLVSISELPCNVEYMDLAGTAIEKLPESLGKLSNLQTLYLSGTPIEVLPVSLAGLRKLQILDLRNSNLRQLPSDLGELESLTSLNLSGCSSLPFFENLKELYEHHADGRKVSGLSHLTENPIGFGHLSSLHKLDLSHLNFKILPTGITDHPCLRILNISCCEKVQFLPDLPYGLLQLLAYGCKSLKVISGLPPLFREMDLENWNHLEPQEFDFLNCSKLDSNTLEDAVERALLNIQCKRPQIPKAMICYPGNKVPEWFMFQSIGSSMTFKLQPGWFNENFIGFALCTVVEARECQNIPNIQIDIRCKCELKSNDISWIVDLGNICYYNPETGPYFGSNHVVIEYDLREFDHFDKNKNANEASVQFFVQDLSGRRIPDERCNVRRCGIHILYANDIEEPYPKRRRYC